MKTAIVYYSQHHGNTKKLLDAIKASSGDNIVLIDAAAVSSADLSGYDRIGFASGIYYSKFHKSVLNFAKNNLPDGKNVFFICTYGTFKDGYTKAIRAALDGRHAHVLGEYGCLGFNTFGPFKLIGGMAKGHPDREELDKAVAFYNNL